MADETIQNYRKLINKIDQEIISLLDERYKHAKAIGNLKKESNLPIYSPEREKEILSSLIKFIPEVSHLTPQAIKSIYKEIFSLSRTIQQSITIGYLGPENTFSHQAALQHFGSSPNYLPFQNVNDIFSSVEQQKITYGVVPIENSIEGSVTRTLDALSETSLVIIGETILPIQQNFIVNPGVTDLSSISKVYSHTQGLGQCQQWLRKNVSQAELQAVQSTSHAVTLIKKHPNEAAIASKLAADANNLTILVPQIEDEPNNETRFYIIGSSAVDRAEKNKTTILFAVPHKAGALFTALKPFYTQGINMTKIESRPIRRANWEYIFFIEILGHQSDPKIETALKQLSDQTLFTKVLGSYPAFL